MKNSYFTVTDQFCGAGGSSQGIRELSRENGGGIEVKLALNHWKLAIETHNTNFPNTLHDCTDISACDPRRYPKTNMLITSPECTNHSLAKGKKRKQSADLFDSLNPEEERSRATMWDVPRFAEYHNYELIIVENVVDARYWIMWDAWIKAMHLLGYLHECVYLNSMHAHPTPQSRDRMYVVFWKKGNKAPDLNIRPVAHCHKCLKDTETYQSWKNPNKKWGKYRQQYVYRCTTCNTVVEPYYYAAFNCIDWSIPGTRIGDRAKPLSENTIRRIQYGIEKYWSTPQIITTRYTSGLDCRVRSVEDVIPTQPGDQSHALLTPLLLNSEHDSTKNEKVRDGLKNPLYTQTTRATNAVVMPIIVENYGTSLAKSSAERLACLTTNNKLGLLSHEALQSFLTHYYGNGFASDVKQPTGTITTKDRFSLVRKGQTPKLEDCFYRMLLPQEVKLGMAFDKDYVVLGNSKEQVKQCGNAVTPPAMKLLSGRCIETLF